MCWTAAELSFSAIGPPSSPSAATASSASITIRPSTTSTPPARSSCFDSCSLSHSVSPSEATRPATAPIARRRAGSPGDSRIAAAHAIPVRSPAAAGTPAWANRHAASSSSSSGSVAATIVGAGLAAAPAMIPSRTAAHDSSTAPAIPAGVS